MNKKPIETARDADLRFSAQAMQRAANRARELAAQTGTAVVVSHGGVLEQIRPQAGKAGTGVFEPFTPYGKKP